MILAERLTERLVGRAGRKPMRMPRKSLLRMLPQVAVVLGMPLSAAVSDAARTK